MKLYIPAMYEKKPNFLHFAVLQITPFFHINSKSTQFTPDRQHSKTILSIDERGSKIDRNNVFDCLMAIKIYVSNYFYLCTSIVLTFSIAAYPVFCINPKLLKWLVTYRSLVTLWKHCNFGAFVVIC